MRLSMMILALVTLAACGQRNNDKSENSLKPKVEMLQAEDDVETYMASLIPINSNVSRATSGAVTIHREGDFISAHVRMNGSDPKVVHAQNIHIGTTCPYEASDTNLDGVIDAVEASPSTEGIIVPLDGDINTQYSLLNMYPVSDDWGSYIYYQTASYKIFMEDWERADENTEDDIIKPSILSFNLDGKVVMIQGISDDLQLPSTVESKDGLKSNQTLPVACGILRRVWTIPGEFEDGDATVGTTRVRPIPRPVPGRRNNPTSPLEPRKPCIRTASGKECQH